MNALEEAQKIYDQLVAWRRDLHQHPEMGMEEYRTAKFAAGMLRELGYAVQEGVAQTGVIGVLENGPGPVIMSRVDMDALPIQEMNDVPYASTVPGMMHACGHDAHVAIGLGIAMLMVQHRESWNGTLKLIFQPGEEGMNGAEKMVAAGALEAPRPDAALAIHVWNALPVGKVGVTPGPVMAAAESWEVTITGKGGHAAQPHKTVDPLTIAALTVTNLQSVVSRNVDPQGAAVVSIGRLRSGDTFNVIPETAEMQGTIRTYDPNVRETVLCRVQDIIEGTARMMGARSDFTLYPLAPAVINDPKITALVHAVAADLLGADAIKTDERTMGSEDAAFFLNEVPGCYIFVGSGPKDRPAPSHHSPIFDIEEEVLPIGVALVVESLCRLMPRGEK
ncbi:MAG: amidohydrolase [Anaerolineae bacterium]|nr:amidohydrolase [Anaerolineae bacterium]